MTAPRSLFAFLVLAVAAPGIAVASLRLTVLPNGWALRPPQGAMVQTGTMPQGAALSPDGSTLAVVESGVNPPALTLYSAADLHLVRRVALTGAFGRPLWNGRSVEIAGANAGSVVEVAADSGSIRFHAVGKNSYPVAIAMHGALAAVSTNGDGAVRIGKLGALDRALPIRVGDRPGNMAFSNDGRLLYVAVRSASYVARIDVRTHAVLRIATGLHPSDVLVSGNHVYVAESDADTVGDFDAATGKRIGDTFVGTMAGSIGSSPNALAARDGALYVSLGAANEIAMLRDDRVVARFATGWYPTDVVPVDGALLAIDGKGEGATANPGFTLTGDAYYIGSIEDGSIRRIALSDAERNAQGAQGSDLAAPPESVIRAQGPIRHVFFILKENRTYDQILGDDPAGDGDAALAWFGKRVTPNQHALAHRFGLLDNAYADGEVSDPGHNWADGAFANDYVQRVWPPGYGDRGGNDDVETGAGAPVPAEGFMWDNARRSKVSFRDYGEMAQTAAGLAGLYDPKYVGWDLDYSDLDRVKEWKREFGAYLANGTLPQLEWIWLPNDHTYGSKAGKPTPAAYVATNDYAVGSIVQAISHSKIWPSSAIFITEDDAQNGADHVCDQRTTFYVVSPYARGGTIHTHYSTVSLLRTIELLLGMRPMSNYDRTAVPLYDAFTAQANLAPFDAISPGIDTNARNAKTAYGERRSELADFSREDAVSPPVLTDILAHNREVTPAR